MTKAARGPLRFTLRLDGASHSVAYLPGRTLLDCVLAAGLEAPFLCRQGECGTCMSLLRSGAVRMLDNRVLSRRDLEAGYVLACQSLPVDDRPIELDMDA